MQDTKFFTLALALENATQEELDLLVKHIQSIVDYYTKGGVITDQQAMTQSINKEIDKFYKQFVVELKDTAKAVGALQAETAIKTVIPLLKKAGLYKEAIELYTQVRKYAEDVEKRFMFNKWADIPLEHRLKTIKAGTQKTVQNIIMNGMNEGKGAKAIAKELRQYISPVEDLTKTKPYDEYRKRFGRPKSFTPKGVPAGSVQYNALRIARTETARVYREATVDFYEDKDYVNGYTWNLSRAHPVKDECDDYARKTYKTRDELPKPHPQCLCFVRPIVMTLSELQAYRNRNNEPEDVYAQAVKISKELIGVAK